MVRPKKHLGQHFLKDENIAWKIVDSLTGKNYDEILEIGPGTGVLTKFLIQDKHEFSVVEVDSESVEYLKQNYKDLKIFEEDFLKMDFKKSFKNKNFAVIGNFPYNISSQIVFKILENHNQVPEMVGMFQKEVAERICSPKGSKVYGILSVLTQAYYNAEYLFTVSENVFNPSPKVKSGVIRLIRKDEEPKVEKNLLFSMVKTAFNQRRKTLRNSLKIFLKSHPEFDENILNLRAEQLSVAEFIELADKIGE